MRKSRASPVGIHQFHLPMRATSALLDPSAPRRLIEAYTSGAPDRRGNATPLPQELTAREIELLTLIAAGLTNAEIAERLVISPLTVKSHVSRNLAKMSARDRTQLVVMAYESGLVVPGSLFSGSRR